MINIDLWPTALTMTYDPILAKVKVDFHAKNKGHRLIWSVRESHNVGKIAWSHILNFIQSTYAFKLYIKFIFMPQ